MNPLSFQDATRSGLYRLPPAQHAGLEKAAQAAGLRFIDLRIEPAAARQAILRDLGRALAFPDWYGANLDALYDCLTDPDWQPASDHLVSISGLAGFRTTDPDGFEALTEILRSAIDSRRVAGRRLWVLVDAPAPDIAPLPSA